VSPVALFVGVLAGILVWIFVVRRLTAKSWQSAGTVDPVGVVTPITARLGLWMFLAVVTSFFGLFISAYSMRMHHGDWTHVAEPDVLWINTAMLILSSVAVQTALVAIKHQQRNAAKVALIATGVFALAFLAGQLVAWQQLSASGQFIRGSPATAFFYVLTAVHGLHLLGGLWVWGRTTFRLAGRGAELIDVRLSVELCTVYWHYLLLVWFVLFGLLLST
jgi:cytochrome c oxidase subunit 3